MDSTQTGVAPEKPSREASTPGEFRPGTLTGLFLESGDHYSGRSAFRFHQEGVWKDISHDEARRTVAKAVGALKELGMERGDRAAILSENRPEWALADYACLMAGVVDVPVYATLTPGQVAYILNDAGARLVFCSDREQLTKLLEARADAGKLEWIVVFEDDAVDSGEANRSQGVLTWSEFLEKGASWPGVTDDEVLRGEGERAEPADVATILYTSGTTGDPKGVMLTHDNLFSNVQAARSLIPVGPEDSTLSFLPLSHVFQRMVDYLLFSSGVSIAYARSLDTVPEDLKAIRPTIVVSVPRLYEKVYARVMEAGGVKGKLVQWARSVGERWSDLRLAGRTAGFLLGFQHRIADALVFKKLRAGVGGRLRFFVSGGAPLAPEINRFFYAAGITILEGYGLTETSPVTNVNTPERFKIGTVGPPVPGTEIRIADDGEILVRGPQVMKGYYNRPEETAEVLSSEGWFHTGDIGELDADGFLRITDRKKDIIVTAGGKNVAPQPIENRLKKNRFIDQPVLLGDRRKFLTLLLVPAFENLEAWARQQGIASDDRRELLEKAEVQELLAKEVDQELRDYARFELPKKILLLDQEFTIEDGSLTPTQKVKRRVVDERFREAIDRVYEESESAPRVGVA